MPDVAHVMTPRLPRPQLRLSVWGAAAASLLAWVAFGLATLGSTVPQPGYAVLLFTLATVFATVAAALISARSRADGDDPLRWVGAGLVVGCLAMVLQLISFPAVTTGGGPFGTSAANSALLYLLFHWSLVLFAAAGLARLAVRWCRPAAAAGCLIVTSAALDLLPTPELLRADASYTSAFIVTEQVSAAVALLVTLAWVVRSARHAPAWYGWVAMALAFSAYDILLNSVAGRRYDEQWWASLALRVATYGVPAVAGLVMVLLQLRRQERYTEAELDRREAELSASLLATATLLNSAHALADAAGKTDAATVVAATAVAMTGAPRAVVELYDPATATLSLLGSVGTDPETDRRLVGIGPAQAMPGSFVLRSGAPVYSGDERQTRELFAGLADVPGLAATSSVAALPLKLATGQVGMLVVTDDRERPWPTRERELLTGLAAQAAQALQRAELFDRERETAQTLQRGMLPRRLEATTGVQVTARYLPGAQGMTVGGDWYDSIPLLDGRTVLVVGDVMGKGAEAAAVMGRTRSVVRALAAVDPEPVPVLRALDRVVADLTPDGFITLLYVLLDPLDRTATIARAGHLPLLLAAPGQPPRLVYDGGSEIIGAPEPERIGARIELPPGATLGLFTDGLVENRTTGLDPGLQRLTEALPDLDRTDLDEVAEQLLALGQEARSYDDVCVLLARLTPPPDESSDQGFQPITG